VTFPRSSARRKPMYAAPEQSRTNVRMRVKEMR
jgi:hypothetical protein